MANNTLPNALEALFTLAEDMKDGCNTYEATIGLKQNKESDVDAAEAPALIATENYDNARALKVTRTTAQTVADSNAKTYLSTARKILALRYGETWSDAWLPTGFPDQSTAVPDTIEKRQTLLEKLRDYFTTNPTHEVAALNLTAAQADILFDALSAARSTANASLTDCGQKKVLRDDAIKTLRKRMRGLIDELGQLLEDNDPLWHSFGLVPPGTPNTPDIPDAPVLTPGTPGTVIIHWADAPRANYYRVFKQVIGTDADYVFVDNPHDTTLNVNLPTGATVKIAISAVNDAGESGKSDATQIVVP